MSKGSPSRSLLRSLIERFQRVSISELYRVALVLWMPNQTYREGQECSHVIYKDLPHTSYSELLSRPMLEFTACEKYSPHAVPHVPIDDQYGVWLPRGRLIAAWRETMDAEAGFKQLVNDELTRAKMLQERAEKGDDPWDRIEYTVTEKCRVKAIKVPRLVFAAEDVMRGYGTLVWPASAT